MQKNNLFILHTQYNLILACGLVKTLFSNYRNDLVLNAEFKLSESLQQNLEKTFENILVLSSKKNEPKSAFATELDFLKRYRKFKKAKNISLNVYETVFLSQERRFDTLLYREIRKLCPAKCFYLEDGSDVYFSIDVKRSQLDRGKFERELAIERTKKSLNSRLRETLVQYFYGRNPYDIPIYCYGMSNIFQKRFVLFPKFVRSEIDRSSCEAITQEMILSGIPELYGHHSTAKESSKNIIFLILDLIESVTVNQEFEIYLGKILEWGKLNDTLILYKYHPRETNEYLTFEKSCSGLRQIDKTIPSEKVLFDMRDNNVTLIGNLSTSILVGKKMGFDVICIGKILQNENFAAYRFFNDINIQIPENFDSLLGLIEQ